MGKGKSYGLGLACGLCTMITVAAIERTRLPFNPSSLRANHTRK
jgi:hypothetical protein